MTHAPDLHSSTSESRPRLWPSRPLPFFAGALALALIVASADRGLSTWRAAQTEPGLGAPWLWIEGASDLGEPVAFYAVRDVRLEAPGPVWLSVVADEEYVLFVNGRHVGGGAYRPGAPADLWDLTDHLDGGWNRVMLELRSARGAGGFLARLRFGAVDGPEAPEEEAPGSWTILRRHSQALASGWLSLDQLDGEAPQSWRAPPTGRWRPAAALAAGPEDPPTFRPPPIHRPVRVRHPSPGSEWVQIDSSAPRLPALGSQSLFDFGREVEGRLVVELDPASGAPALLFWGPTPPSPQEERADGVLVPVPGAVAWRDAHVRRFRYLAIIGTAPKGRLYVETVGADVATATEIKAAEAKGVFGLEPASEHLAVEEWVWRRLRRKSKGDDGAEASTEVQESGPIAE